MRIDEFAMERLQSTYEHVVEFNLSESGVHPLRLEELLEEPSDREALLRQTLGYTQSNGTLELRAAIAAMYPGATVDHVEVTNGGSEANYIALWSLLEPGDEVVFMTPNYMQGWGLARAFAGRVREWPLRQQQGSAPWQVDLNELESLINARTKLIIICNPNNPTGACFRDSDLNAICDLASRQGAWLLADEIYRGAEREGEETPSVWGRYDRALITSGLSKAYGLPGLRIGWIVGPPALIASFWSYHDYTTIAPGTLSDRLAQIALAPRRRTRLLERTRSILRDNFGVLSLWLSDRRHAFSYAPPQAGAIAYVRYSYRINSTELATRLRQAKSVLVVPGDHFGMDGYLRIGYGVDPACLRAGLTRLDEVLEAVESSRKSKVEG